MYFLFFPISRLLSIPGTPQPCLISVQPNWIKDGPWDLCPKYPSLQGRENQKHGNQKQSCHRANGSRNDLRESKRRWCKAPSIIPLKKQCAGQDPSTTKPVRRAPSRWKRPQRCLRGFICVGKFQSTHLEFLSSKSCWRQTVLRDKWGAMPLQSQKKWEKGEGRQRQLLAKTDAKETD